MLISSADLLGTAAIACDRASAAIVAARSHAARPVDEIDKAEEHLVQALAELRVARDGIVRRSPQFDDAESDALVERAKFEIVTRGLIERAATTEGS